MADDVWSAMPFDQAVQVNPAVRLERGSVYPFVDMQAVDQGSRSVGPSELREFHGGGSRFINGDTLMARITPCLENGKIARYSAPKGKVIGHGSTEFIVIRGRPNVTDNDFAYYLTKWDGVRRYCISQMTGSSGRQRVPISVLSHCEVTIPPLKEQQAIARILGTLDDKIELNRRMNQTLEEMARAIFKSWFVDFDPVRAKAAVRREHPDWTNEQVSRAACPKLKPEIAELFPDSFEDSELGEIPKGWRIGKFGDCCNVKGGYAYKSKDFADEGYPLVRIKNITTEKTVDLFDVVYIPEDIALQTRSFWLSDGDLLMAMTGATIGKFGLIVNRKEMSPAVLNQRVAKIAQKNTQANKSWFIFVALIVTDVYEQVLNIGGGSAQPNISSSQIENCRFVGPSDAIILSFTNHVDPIMQKWLSNLKEVAHLATLRDTLLPKLISGELRIPDAERIAGRCV